MAERAPNKEGQKLVSKDYSDRVGTLGEDVYMNRRMLLQAVGHFDPENISFQRMYQMRRDPMIQMGLHFIKFPLIRAPWHIECEDPRIAAALEEIIGNVYGSYMRTMLNMLDFGFQAAIKQFELGELSGTFEDAESGEVKPVWDEGPIKPVVLGAPLPLPPEYTTVKLEKGKFVGINSSLSKAHEQGNPDKPDIPAEWALWMTNEFEENFRNWYGYPRTGYAYRFWWSYWFRFHMEDRHFEMDADPPLEVQYPPGSHKDPTTGETKTNKEIALQIGQDARQGATIAVPSDVFVDDQGKAVAQPLWALKFLQGGENLSAFRESAEYQDVMKLRAMLVPEQALVEGKGGTDSRASSTSYGEIFQESLAELADYKDDHFNKHIVPQLVEANFGADAPKAKMVTSGFESEDMELANELIKIAFNLDPNALPIDVEELLRKANLPLYSKKEQEEREEKIEEMKEANEKAEAEAQAREGAAGGEGEGGEEGGGGGNEGGGPKPGIALAHQHAETVDSHMPSWAKNEFKRRERNQAAIAERLQDVTQERYATFFAALAEYVEGEQDKIELSVASTVKDLVTRAARYAKNKAQRFREPLIGEMASLYHAAGAAELSRLGLDMSGWDIGRQEVQEWAEQHAGELITTMDQTVVEQHLRPFLSQRLEEENVGFEGQDPAPIDALRLAQEISDKFESYPEWMAKRVARTEARNGYNLSAADMWERVGVPEVQLYDGQGGESGKTDIECLHRNGEIVSVDEFIRLNAEEHPNGTLGALPHVTDPEQLRNIDSGTLLASAVQSASIYAVDGKGNILTEQETGDLLAG